MPIERKEVFTDDAIGSPLIMAENFDKLAASVEKLIVLLKQSGQNIKAADTTSKLAKETDILVLAQKEQEKVTKQLAVAQVRQSEEYQKTKKQIADLNKEIKVKNELGDRDAKTITAQNASINQLTAALNKNREAYKNLTTEEQRTSKQGKELLAIIDSQDKSVKELNGSIGKHQDNVGDYRGAMKDLKLEFKAAKDEMVGIGKTLGTTSPEYLKAAEKAGALKDEIGDLSKSIDNVSGSKLENLTSSFGDTFSKLAKGDMSGALESAKQFAAVSKSITFAEAGKTLKQFGQTILTVGKAILTNPMFLIPALIAGVVYALYKFRDSIPFVAKSLKVLGDGWDYVIGKVKQFTDYIGLTTFAIDEQREAAEQAAADQIEAAKKLYDTKIKIAQAEGKDTTALERAKWEAVITAANQGRDALLKESGDYTEEELEKFAKYKSDLEEAYTELAIMKAQKNKEAHEKELAEEKKHFDTLLKVFEDNFKKYEDLRKKQDITEAQRAVRDKKNADEDAKRQKEKADALVPITALQKKYNLTKEEEANIQAKLAPLIAETNEEIKKASQLQSLIDFLGTAQKVYSQFASNVGGLFNALSAQRIANFDLELRTLEAQTDREILLAGNNDAAKRAIEENAQRRREQIEKKRLAEQQRQAKFNKALAIVQAIINTAVAVTANLAFPVLAAIIAALGAVEVAAISAQPIPKYAKGVKDKPKAGFAVVGERGSELLRIGNNYQLTPDSATLMHLPKGTDVIPHDETMRILALSSLGDQTLVQQHQNNNSELVNELREMKYVNQQIVKAIVANGIDLEQQGTTLINWHRDANGNKSSIRKKAMGY